MFMCRIQVDTGKTKVRNDVCLLKHSKVLYKTSMKRFKGLPSKAMEFQEFQSWSNYSTSTAVYQIH